MTEGRGRGGICEDPSSISHEVVGAQADVEWRLLFNVEEVEAPMDCAGASLA